MFRPSASPRLVVGLALAAVVGSGIGLGVASLGSASGTTTPLAHQTLAAAASTATAASTAAAPATSSAPSPASAELTVDQAKAVALRTSPGTVVDVELDNPAADPSDPAEATDPADPAEATTPADPSDPADPTTPADPTGPSYQVTVLHSDGTATEVVVDAMTGRVISTTQKDDWQGN